MSDYVVQLMAASDEDLAKMLAGPMPGSTNHELIKFEMQRRAMIAQKRAAEASEKYTRLTGIFIIVTALGAAANAVATFLK
ncbi:MAG TPA: hypothetical protein VFW35_13010 [Sphingomicrobium sp.]|nr:hypothetical protein [Sphingomicrobium sp.]